jgi:hypothetical protein
MVWISFVNKCSETLFLMTKKYYFWNFTSLLTKKSQINCFYIKKSNDHKSFQGIFPSQGSSQRYHVVYLFWAFSLKSYWALHPIWLKVDPSNLQ